MRFCGNCGTALAGPGEAVEERKLVTVLFIDVAESTRLSSELDPELLRERMARFFTVAEEEIERYGGTVEKYIGDAVMAIFGLPAVHEDDPERAGRAALAIRDRTLAGDASGPLPPIRLGLNTGEVVANPHAAGKGEFLVTGEVVNVAARLQQHAAPGQIVVGERIARALRRLADLREIPPILVKGKPTPLAVWELTAISPPRERALRATPFVGREEELSVLLGHLRRAHREGRGHVITILGPAGVGKTRLSREFRIRGTDAHTLSGRAVPYGTGVPFWALGEAIRVEIGVAFGDPLEAARAKLQAYAQTLDIPEAVPALASVLGLSGDGADLSREVLFGAMRAFFQALAQRRPMLLVVEDAHLADDVTLDFLDHAADWIRDIPMLLLLLARPELLERRQSWMGGKRGATTMTLDPLGDAESQALIGAVLQYRPAPEALGAAIIARAGGNPLFMEEILRALIEQGTLSDRAGEWVLVVPLTEVSIPDTVHAVIAARVDALPTGEKQVLQAAALQGKDFYLGGLHVTAERNHVEDALQSLVAKELVIPKRQSTLRGESEFTFRHILIRDVAYSSIPKSQRWPRHGRIAEWMEQVIGERLPEFADIIAHHWLQTLALRAELGLPDDTSVRRHAVANLLVAGDRAAGVYANTTALDHYTRALDLTPAGADRLHALQGRGTVWMLLGQFERAREDFHAARTLARDVGDRRTEAMALDHLGHSHRRQDQVGIARDYLHQALAISREIGDPGLSGRILNHIAFTDFSDGRFRESLTAHEEARPLLEQADDTSGLAECMHGQGDALLFLGAYRESIQTYLEAIQLCGLTGNRSLDAESRFMIGFARHKLGQFRDADAEIERSLSIIREIGDVWNLPPALVSGSLVALMRGNFGKAFDYLTRGLNMARQIGVTRFIAFHLYGLGALHRELDNVPAAAEADREAAEHAGLVGGGWLPVVRAAQALDAARLGDHDGAAAHLDGAWRTLEQRGRAADFQQEITLAEGHVMLERGAPDAAAAAADRLLRIASETGTEDRWRASALALKAHAFLKRGDPAEALRLFEDAAAEAARVDSPPLRWRALAGAAIAQQALHRSDDARHSARQAREIIDRLAATLPDERLRAALLQSSAVQSVASIAAGS